jgi:CheY-like chemotaxis protein
MSTGAAFRKTRILIADDEKTIADTLSLILAGAGYEVSVAYDGLAAVTKAEEWPPDLFLTDVVMPRLTGIEAALEICRRLPDCRVLLISGQANLKDIRREIKSKCDRFEVFQKPLHPTELIAHIERLL